MQTKKVENYSLGAFIKDVLEARDEGFEVDFESNDNAPVAFGGYYLCIMVKKENKEVIKPTQDAPVQLDPEEGDDDKDETPTRRKGGRKAKTETPVEPAQE